MQYIYLHGFASSPSSFKAQYLAHCFADLGLSLTIPDLNQGDFTHLTLTRQLYQVADLLGDEPATLIGSSLGGLTSAWLAQQKPQVDRLVLLAPAFQFLTFWLARLDETTLQKWQSEGVLPIYHYGEKTSLPLHYKFLIDAARYQDTNLQRPVPTLILHGIHDETIPVQASRDYATSRAWVQLAEMDSDHALGNVMLDIWQAIRGFCNLG